MTDLLYHLLVHLLLHLMVVVLPQLLKYLIVWGKKNLRANLRVQDSDLPMRGAEIHRGPVKVTMLAKNGWI
jgi:hypothetical protein